MTRLLLTLMLAALVQAAALAQRSPDFAEKFMTLCAKDSTVKCVTVSPKMMAQLVKQNNTDHPENLLQAMSKLKSARIQGPAHLSQRRTARLLLHTQGPKRAHRGAHLAA